MTASTSDYEDYEEQYAEHYLQEKEEEYEKRIEGLQKIFPDEIAKEIGYREVFQNEEYDNIVIDHQGIVPYTTAKECHKNLRKFLEKDGARGLVEVNILRQGTGKTEANANYLKEHPDTVCFTPEHKHIEQTLNRPGFIHLKGFERTCNVLNLKTHSQDKVKTLSELGVEKQKICNNTCSSKEKKVCPYQVQWKDWKKKPVVAPYEFVGIPQAKQKTAALYDEIKDIPDSEYFDWNETSLIELLAHQKYNKIINKINEKSIRAHSSIDTEITNLESQHTDGETYERAESIDKELEKLRNKKKHLIKKIDKRQFNKNLTFLKDIALEFLKIVKQQSILTKTTDIEEIKKTTFYRLRPRYHSIIHLVNLTGAENLYENLYWIKKQHGKDGKDCDSSFMNDLEKIYNQAVKTTDEEVIKRHLGIRRLLSFMTNTIRYLGTLKAIMYERLEVKGGKLVSSMDKVYGLNKKAWLSYAIPGVFKIFELSNNVDKTKIMCATAERRGFKIYKELFNLINFNSDIDKDIRVEFTEQRNLRPYKTKIIEITKTYREGGRTKSSLITYKDGDFQFNPDLEAVIRLMKEDIKKYGEKSVGAEGPKIIKYRHKKWKVEVPMRKILRERYGFSKEWTGTYKGEVTKSGKPVKEQSGMYCHYGSSQTSGGRQLEECKILWTLMTPHLTPASAIQKYMEVFNRLPPLEVVKDRGPEHSEIPKGPINGLIKRGKGNEFIGYNDTDLQFIFKISVLNPIVDGVFRLRKQEEEEKVIKMFSLVPEELSNQSKTHEKITALELFYRAKKEEINKVKLPAKFEKIKKVIGNDIHNDYFIERVIEAYANEHKLFWDKKIRVLRSKEKSGLKKGQKIKSLDEKILNILKLETYIPTEVIRKKLKVNRNALFEELKVLKDKGLIKIVRNKGLIKIE